MPTLTESPRTGQFLLSEASGTRSREIVTIVSGAGALEPGMVLGKITSSGKFTPADVGATDGSETAAGVLYAAVDATAADVEAVAIVRDAEVKRHELLWHTSVDTAGEKATKEDELATIGIIVR